MSRSTVPSLFECDSSPLIIPYRTMKIHIPWEIRMVWQPLTNEPFFANYSIKMFLFHSRLPLSACDCVTAMNTQFEKDKSKICKASDLRLSSQPLFLLLFKRISVSSSTIIGVDSSISQAKGSWFRDYSRISLL